MDKKRRHILQNQITSITFTKNELKYLILNSIKFNKNIQNINKNHFHFYSLKRSSSVSKLKGICLFSGYKRAIIKNFSSSRFIANKLAKQGLLHNYKP
jgi:ribosomal protein S14